MTSLLELIEGLVELWCLWRLYLCVAIGVLLAMLLHHSIGDAVWVWFVSVPVVKSDSSSGGCGSARQTSIKVDLRRAGAGGLEPLMNANRR
jgi:hypothetical protein